MGFGFEVWVLGSEFSGSLGVFDLRYVPIGLHDFNFWVHGFGFGVWGSSCFGVRILGFAGLGLSGYWSFGVFAAFGV